MMSPGARGADDSGPSVSALVTAFNHRSYVGEALESLLNQSRPADEVLVADDGSSDGTAELVEGYERFGVTLVRTPGGGPSCAMNALLRRARGEVLLLQSGDDVSHPDRVASQLQQLESSDVVSCKPRIIDDAGGVLPVATFPYFSDPPSARSGSALFSHLFYSGNFICAPAVALTRRVLERTGLFHEGLIQLQDHHYWLRASAKGFRFGITDNSYASYRVHAANLSRPANDARTAAELPYVLRTALDELDGEQLIQLLFGQALPTDRQPSTASLRALAFLRHGRPEVRRLGLELLIDELGDTAARERLAQCLSVSPRSVFALISAA